MNDLWREMSTKPADRVPKKYEPEIDDYVIWKEHKGWVYFKDVEYITIELGVKPKPNCQYTRIQRHKYTHTLLLCYPQHWHELEYVHTRKNKYGETLEDMEIFIREF